MVNHHDTNHLNQTNVTAFKLDSNEQFPVGNTERQFNLIPVPLRMTTQIKREKLIKNYSLTLKKKLTLVLGVMHFL